MTWMTPFDWKTSAVVMVAMPPLASVSMILPPDMVAVRSSPWTVLSVALPPPFLIMPLELLGADAAGDDVVGEDLVEGVFVLGFDESLDGAGGEFGEGVIGGREDGEGAGAVEGVDQAASLDGGDEGLVDRRVDCVLDDGLGGVHFCAADGGVFLCVGGERGDGQSSYGQGGEECLLHCRYPLSFLISKTRPCIQGTHKHLRLPTETGLLVFLRCAEIFASEGALVAAVMRT